MGKVETFDRLLIKLGESMAVTIPSDIVKERKAGDAVRVTVEFL